MIEAVDDAVDYSRQEYASTGQNEPTSEAKRQMQGLRRGEHRGASIEGRASATTVASGADVRIAVQMEAIVCDSEGSAWHVCRLKLNSDGREPEVSLPESRGLVPSSPVEDRNSPACLPWQQCDRKKLTCLRNVGSYFAVTHCAELNQLPVIPPL